MDAQSQEKIGRDRHGVGRMIEEIENYINGEDYPDEIPKRIMGLFEREHADLLAEVERLQQLIVDAAWQLHWNVGATASSSHLSSKEWDENIYAPAQAWRKQVQEILDASEEGCPWKQEDEMWRDENE